jgi:hypothetical protein
VAKTFKRIDLGFDGGQMLSARVEQDDYEKIQKALSKSDSDRWFSLDGQDAEVLIDLSKVVYLRVDKEDTRVGF